VVKYIDISPYSNKADFLANNTKLIVIAENYFNVGVRRVGLTPENKDIANDERG